MLVDINWNNFKAKFDNHEQSAFERLCYLLFCKEHGKDTGLSRFKNQAGIETNPIEINNEVIGWQAKFYGTPLSQHTAELIQSVDTTKARYPSITKLVFIQIRILARIRKRPIPSIRRTLKLMRRLSACEFWNNTRIILREGVEYHGLTIKLTNPT